MRATWWTTSAPARGSSPPWERRATRVGHHPRVSMGPGYVDLKLVSDDAIYRDDDGTEHVVEWVTQQDVDLARRITEVAADHGLDADPASVCDLELGLDTAPLRDHRPGVGRPADRARRLPGPRHPERRGPRRHGAGAEPVVRGGRARGGERSGSTSRCTSRRRRREQRIAAAVAAGGTVVDDSDAPSLTVIADQDGNRGVLCVAAPPKRD